ncbi:alanine--tRNA ligase [Bacteroidia bacterium]|nr:alanine--tRNA ligase [Bacteroidia bacterium]MDB9881826.1 alanine--tRNA ligase [Bacteroidia bacterium]
MTASEIRRQYLDFFRQKGHKIVDSAPIVVKDDPTLMFTNAGMNQFKDIFLGNKEAKDVRVVDTQKCLRVSGKHNDLEEVGVDTYHHTMFEMLGNWSFGDYFKEDSINWAWELLTEVFKLDKTRLYVSVFEGDASDKLELDSEAKNLWLKHVPEERIILGNKKDNFWEMGETGPCGPCSEIHIDLRDDDERAKLDGASLVNADHEQVIEIWNLVFMQYNRKADKSLHPLPNQHVDTGMGFERLVRAVHGHKSNYDSDLFMDTIRELESLSGKKYGDDEPTDIAFRVIADHLRAVCFAIADGQLPDNNGAGYVIRRILRRALRYGYSFLGLEKPFMKNLVPDFVAKFKDVFAGIDQQKDFLEKVVEQEEKSFLNTLNKGLKLVDDYSKEGNITGAHAFELYDTFGFPIDLTELLAKEKGIEVDIDGFKAALQEQKDRSRADAKKESGDWIVLEEDDREEFVGYDYLESDVKITRYREVTVKGKKQYHLVLNLTPFFAESGGQVGDKGVLIGKNDDEKIGIIDTQKENQLSIQIAEKLPQNLNQHFKAKVNLEKRTDTSLNHSATHLLQSALRQVLGDHVAQKGSLVNEKHLRFDFSHFQKVEKSEVEQIEKIVNQKIRDAIALEEARNVPFDEATKSGAMALFGEKYGDTVRVITFDKDYSVELCGGCHVSNTALIGSFKIVHEGAVAAGVRRIEAITGAKADAYVKDKLSLIEQIGAELGNQQDILKAIQSLQKENVDLKSKVEAFENSQLGDLKGDLMKAMNSVNGVNSIIDIIKVSNAGQAKDLAFQLKEEVEDLFCVLLADIDGKPSISIMISDSLVKGKGYNAGQLIREWAREVKGGGGGQPFFAQAGGADVSGLPEVKELAINFVNS